MTLLSRRISRSCFTRESTRFGVRSQFSAHMDLEGRVWCFWPSSVHILFCVFPQRLHDANLYFIFHPYLALSTFNVSSHKKNTHTHTHTHTRHAHQHAHLHARDLKSHGQSGSSPVSSIELCLSGVMSLLSTVALATMTTQNPRPTQPYQMTTMTTSLPSPVTRLNLCSHQASSCPLLPSRNSVLPPCGNISR